MKELILKFACFLTGYNYAILRSCSENSRKAVKKNFSALIIVSLIWGFIGYTFAERYVGVEPIAAGAVAVVMVIVVINIERQIIMNVKRNNWAYLFRTVIAVVMAIIGAVIVDQTIFKEDIEKRKISSVQDEVDAILPKKTFQLDREIGRLDSMITAKETERQALIEEVTKTPFIKTVSSQKRVLPVTKRDAMGNAYDSLEERREYTVENISNPKNDLIEPLNAQIDMLLQQKAAKESEYTTIRQDLEEDLRSRTGFLDELVILKGILLENWVAMFVYACFFLFFLAIELFILVNKGSENKDKNDYDSTVLHQQEIRKLELVKLAEKRGVVEISTIA